MIEPRVMQLLVTLARRRGEVVGRQSRSSLLGRVDLGEDAVSRVILKLRRALEEIGGGITVETVAMRRLGVVKAMARDRLEASSRPSDSTVLDKPTLA